ncbi:MAG: MBL fold metallo-hydrolase [Bacteroidetes bacterium]|nr:MAG: MBL fold metallo-hydrolase [Bacteroidota bacterium]
MIYIALGASDEIGGSCHYLNIHGTGLLLDSGIDPEEEGLAGIPRLDIIDENSDYWVDHAIITHAHHDHIGAMPVVLQKFPHAIAHMSGATEQLAEILLPASARLQLRKQREGTSTSNPLFYEEELDAYSYLYRSHDLNIPFDVTGVRASVPVRASFYDAGHILGSVGILLEFESGGEEKRYFYTGDTGMRAQTIIPGAEYPDSPIDVLFLESTLGADPESEKTSRRTEENGLAEAVAEVLKRGGTVLLPVFALGRGQEIIALVDRYKKRGLIPEETPVYTAGLMRAISDVYDKTRFSTPRLNPDFEVYGVSQSRLPRSHTATLLALTEPSIHIVGSGMMFERTISNRLAQQLVESDKNGIFMVGYTRPDSPGHRLLEARRAGKGTKAVLDENKGPQSIQCDVDRFRFSGHSHRRDLMEVVKRLNPGRIVLVHGETEARAWMKNNIEYFYPEIDVISPQTGEVVEL